MVDMAWLITTASMSFGSMPAGRIVVSSLPVVGPNSLSEPIPVSNSTSLLPVLRIRMFCSSTAFDSGRKLLVSCASISAGVRPRKLVWGSPSGRVPSETMVASASPRVKR